MSSISDIARLQMSAYRQQKRAQNTIRTTATNNRRRNIMEIQSQRNACRGCGSFQQWWVNCHHFKLLISHIRFIWFKFCLLWSKLVTVEHCLWDKQHHDTIHSSKNLETVCCTNWHPLWKCQHEDFTVFRCQSKDWFIFILMKNLTHCPHHGALGSYLPI